MVKRPYDTDREVMRKRLEAWRARGYNDGVAGRPSKPPHAGVEPDAERDAYLASYRSGVKARETRRPAGGV